MITREKVANFFCNRRYEVTEDDMFKSGVEDFTDFLDYHLCCPKRVFVNEINNVLTKDSMNNVSPQEFTKKRNKIMTILDKYLNFYRPETIRMNEGDAIDRWLEVMQDYTDRNNFAVLMDGGKLLYPKGICDILQRKKDEIGSLERVILVSRTYLKPNEKTDIQTDLAARGFSRDSNESEYYAEMRQHIILRNSEVFASATEIKRMFPEMKIMLALDQHIKCFACNKEDFVTGSCNFKGFETNTSTDIMTRYKSQENVDLIHEIVNELANSPTTIHIV